MKKQDIKDLMQFFDTTGLTKLKIKEGEFEVELEKKQEVVQVAAAPVYQQAPSSVTTCTTISAPEAVAPVAPAGLSIKSPMVGTFYKAPSPDAAPFVKVGQVVKKGQTIAIIEAMKIMNEIEAEFDCKIASVLVDDGQPVEFDMPLFSVERV